MSAPKKVLGLGSGRIARPCVQYLLKQGYHVTLMVTQLQKLCMFDDEERDLAHHTFASFTKELTGCKNISKSARESAMEFLNLSEYSLAIEKLEWLGLFDDTHLSPAAVSNIDVISHLYAKKLQFTQGEFERI